MNYGQYGKFGTIGLVGATTSAQPPVPVWTPADIAASLTYWFDAGDETSLEVSANKVSRIKDQFDPSIGLNQSDSALQPSLVTNAVNGRSVARFSNDGAQHLNLPTRRIDIRTVVIMVALDASHLTTNSMFILGDSSSYHFHGNADGTNLLFSSSYTSNSIKPGLINQNGASVGMSVTREATPTIYSFRTTGSVFVSSVAQDRKFKDRSLRGDFCEVIFSTQALDGELIAKLEGYLAHKWATQASLPYSHSYKNQQPTA